MARKIYAVCDRRGVIEFADTVEDGMLLVARGYPRQLRDLIDATSRHAYDGKTLLVPGVPEAANDDAALDALLRHRAWIEGRL
jgi:hypothetical protein